MPRMVCGALISKDNLKLQRQPCYPLTVSDNFSRYLLLCQGLSNTKADSVIAHFEQLFSTYGMPWAIRSETAHPLP